MCGFFGMFSFAGQVKSAEGFLNYALEDLSRRGPDQCGIWKDEQVMLGFRRLSIQDLSEAGNQPMVSSNGNLVIIYNGEIYNVPALLSWAAIDSTQLKGHSDTEVLLLCLEKMGVKETLQQLDGIFAMAVYNIASQSITLARDHAGIKPLYYGYSEEGIVFSSHYHLITAHSYFSNKQLQPAALSNYFSYGFVQEGEGLLKDTFNLPHGHFIIMSKTNFGEWTAYVDSCELYENAGKRPADEELYNVYKNVVASQLISDVPIGTFLSGGVDSAVTTAFAGKHKNNITAFTVGVDHPGLDETSEATRFAKYFDLTHVVKSIDETSLEKLLDDYEKSMAEPLADFSSLMTLKVCQLAKEQFTVALSGDGGDELFWGYPRFREATKYVSFFKASALGKLGRILKSRVHGKKIPIELLRFTDFNQYYLSKQGIPGSGYWTERLLNRDTRHESPYFAKLLVKDAVDEDGAMLYARALEYHIHMQRVLLKVDRASMYHSLEVRTPVLSRQMVQISKRFLYKDCVDASKAKLPLRRMLKSLLPDNVAESGPKKGFSPPLAQWLRGPLRSRFEQVLFCMPSIYTPHISERSIKKMWDQHQSGERDWSWMIWSLYSLFSWTNNKMFRQCM